jgi:hypothetical protein
MCNKALSLARRVPIQLDENMYHIPPAFLRSFMADDRINADVELAARVVLRMTEWPACSDLVDTTIVS